MTPYTPNNAFPNISIYDTSDPVLGGSTGESNDPIKKLADRTQYLYNRLGSYLGQRIVTANAAITIADIFKMVNVVTSNNITLTLDPVANFGVGALLKFKVKTTGVKAVKYLPNASEKIEDGIVEYNGSSKFLYLYDGEEVTLMAANNDAGGAGAATKWIMIEPKGNLNKVGNDRLCRIQPRNTLIANGCQPEIGGTLHSRADYARLWQEIAASAIPDALWNSDIRYKQFFSDGDGASTFRIADMRSMIHKGLDLGRALSLGRLDALPGGLEKDAILEHYHITVFTNNSDNDAGSSKLAVGNQPPEGVPPQYKSNGAINSSNVSIGNVENLVKNAGFYPVIFY